MPLRSIELFTGAGGMALGVADAGFEHVALFERDVDPFATLAANIAAGTVPGIRDWNAHLADVQGVEDFGTFSPLDLTAGGAPCQPFSNAGKREGKADDRNMIPEFVRAVRESAPRAFVLENVRGLVNSTFVEYFGYVQLQLRFPELTRRGGEKWKSHANRLREYDGRRRRGTELVYDVSWQIMNSADFGIPQARERVFIVGFRSDVDADWVPPMPSHSFDALLFDQHVTGDYWRRHGIRRRPAPQRLERRIENLRKGDAPGGLPWITVRDAIGDLPEPLLTREPPGITGHLLYPGARLYHGHTGSDWDLPSKTIKAGAHGVPGGENCLVWPSGRVRYYTVREAARLQTFPDEWLFEGGWQLAMRQIGNAVPRRLAGTVTESIAAALPAAARRVA